VSKNISERKIEGRKSRKVQMSWPEDAEMIYES
jgi:hypothetical protein